MAHFVANRCHTRAIAERQTKAWELVSKKGNTKSNPVDTSPDEARSDLGGLAGDAKPRHWLLGNRDPELFRACGRQSRRLCPGINQENHRVPALRVRLDSKY
jgi:hypothetical protein